MLFLLSDAGSGGSAIPYGSGPDIQWLRIILALALCLALAAASIWALRVRHGLSVAPHWMRQFGAMDKGAQTAPGEQLQLVQRLVVSPGHQLVLVRLGARRYLLHLTASGATQIDCIADGAGPEE
jgi:hypothetical protein